MAAHRQQNLIRKDLLYPDLSYQIIGVLFEVQRTLGHRYHERYYQRAIADAFRSAGMTFREQVPVVVTADNRRIARGMADFVIDGKVVLEIKKGERFLKQNIDQVYSYLKTLGLQLGIIANFTSRGLQFKRIVNIS